MLIVSSIDLISLSVLSPLYLYVFLQVPKYLSDIWEANAGSDVGRLNISASNNGKTVVKLKNRQGLIMPDNMEGATSKVTT